MSQCSIRTVLGGILIAALASGDLQAQWSVDFLSVQRQALAAVSVGGKSFFAGGRQGNSIVAVVDVYDDASGVWSQDALSVPRTALAAAAVGPYALFAGGALSVTTSSAVVDVLDVTTMTWTTATLSQARAGLAATTVGQRVIFAGGNAGGVSNPIASNVVDIYDASLGAPDNPAAWSATTLSEARALIGATTAGSRAIFAGGLRTNATTTATVDIYDANLGAPDDPAAWSTTTLSQARASAAAASTGGRAYFGGGRITQFNTSNVVDIYDAASDSWSTKSLSIKRSDVSAVALGDTVLFAGGFDNNFNASSVVNVLDASTATWGPTMQLSLPHAEMGATTVGDTALFAGGGGAAGASSVVDMYQPTWIDFGSSDGPELKGSGTLAAGSTVILTLSKAPASTQAHLVVGLSQANLSFYGGLLVPSPDLLLTNIPVTASGTLTIFGTLPAGLPSGSHLYFQYIVNDPSANFGLSLSNAIQGVTP